MSSWLKLAGKTAIVTGGSSGIGAAVVRALASEGCRLVISADLTRPGRQDAAAAAAAGGVTYEPLDVADHDAVRDLFRSHPDASILVNCAGITRDDFIDKQTVEAWDEVCAVNLRGTFSACQAFCRLGNAGAIVNLGSVVSEKGNLGQVNYAASKGGVLGLTRALAKEVASKGIRVNAVLPGFIETPMTQAVPINVREGIARKIPSGHFGKPQDVANLVLFLASCERSGYITGQCIECSGMIAL
jgi:NAD(P)-dependent dehydrogenase (short-subunit alcohol dehydrogenase family)